MCALKIKEIETFSIQRKIVTVMTSQSWKTIPHVSYIYEPDVTDFIAYFNQKKATGKLKNISLNSLMLRVIVEGIKVAPKLNAHLTYDPQTVTGELKIIQNINVAVPWILPNGEMMSVNINDIEQDTMVEIQKKVIKMKKTIEDSNIVEQLKMLEKMPIIDNLRKQGGEEAIVKMFSEGDGAIPLEPGTITVSNLGSVYPKQRGFIGLLEIIKPQVFAVGLNSLQEKPGIYIDEIGEKQIGIRQVLPMSLVFDHRAIDFGEVTPFMKKLDEIFSDPTQIELL